MVREVREETVLIVEPIALTSIYKHMGLGIIALIFRRRRTAGELTLSDEVFDFLWLPHLT